MELIIGVARLDWINYFQVVLIPKILASKKVGDFRLITLLKSTFKIIAEILAKRLSSFLKKNLIGDY